MIGEVPTIHGKSIQQWQDEVTAFLHAVRAEFDMTRPIQLAHHLGDESAAVAGVLMYDPSTGEVVVSDGTQYRRLAFAP